MSTKKQLSSSRHLVPSIHLPSWGDDGGQEGKGKLCDIRRGVCTQLSRILKHALEMSQWRWSCLQKHLQRRVIMRISDLHQFFLHSSSIFKKEKKHFYWGLELSFLFDPVFPSIDNVFKSYALPKRPTVVAPCLTCLSCSSVSLPNPLSIAYPAASSPAVLIRRMATHAVVTLLPFGAVARFSFFCFSFHVVCR